MSRNRCQDLVDPADQRGIPIQGQQPWNPAQQPIGLAQQVGGFPQEVRLDPGQQVDGPDQRGRNPLGRGDLPVGRSAKDRDDAAHVDEGSGGLCPLIRGLLHSAFNHIGEMVGLALRCGRLDRFNHDSDDGFGAASSNKNSARMAQSSFGFDDFLVATFGQGR